MVSFHLDCFKDSTHFMLKFKLHNLAPSDLQASTLIPPSPTSPLQVRTNGDWTLCAWACVVPYMGRGDLHPPSSLGLLLLAFQALNYPHAPSCLTSQQNMPLENFLSTPFRYSFWDVHRKLLLPL